MNYIDQIFDRCNIETVCEFLIYGGEPLETNTDSCYERAKKAEQKLNEWLQKQFTDNKELDEHCSIVYSVIGEIQSIYMQIGFKAGFMLAAELGDKA